MEVIAQEVEAAFNKGEECDDGSGMGRFAAMASVFKSLQSSDTPQEEEIKAGAEEVKKEEPKKKAAV